MMKVKRGKIFSISLMLLAFVIVYLFTKPNQENETPQVTQQMIPFKSIDLEFSTLIPSTWHIMEFPQKKAVFFRSNIYKYTGGKESKEEFYNISVQRIQLEEDETLDKLFFSNKQYGENRDNLFSKEKRNDYFIYTSESLDTQDNMLGIFITKDGKSFLRYSLAPYFRERSPDVQDRIIESLNRIVDSTRLF